MVSLVFLHSTEECPMLVTLFRERWAINGARDRNDPHRYIPLPLGDYEMVRIPNPYGYHGDWLVIVQTKIGAPEGWWRGWVVKPNSVLRPSTADLEVVIKE